MTIYIDEDFKCYSEAADGRIAAESDFFDGKAPGFIEGYRFIPEGKEWTRADGATFKGEMVTPWKDWNELDALQREYEQEQVISLTQQNDELISAMAEMVDEVYTSDKEVIDNV